MTENYITVSGSMHRCPPEDKKAAEFWDLPQLANILVVARRTQHNQLRNQFCRLFCNDPAYGLRIINRIPSGLRTVYLRNYLEACLAYAETAGTQHELVTLLMATQESAELLQKILPKESRKFKNLSKVYVS